MNRVFLAIAAFLASSSVYAQEVAHSTGVSDKAFYALGAGLVLGLAGFGCALAQGRIGAAAMDGLARNPQARSSIFVPMIISLVFIEVMGILSFVIAILLQGKA